MLNMPPGQLRVLARRDHGLRPVLNDCRIARLGVVGPVFPAFVLPFAQELDVDAVHQQVQRGDTGSVGKLHPPVQAQALA
jgi:hypothetical protein